MARSPKPHKMNANTTKMRAMVLAQATGPDGLVLREVQRPVPAANEVCIRVTAIGVNRADLVQAHGRYPAPPGVPQDILGLEYAGVIEACGAGVSSRVPSRQVGEPVWGIVGGGAYAEYLTVDARAVAPLPPDLDPTLAAAIPEAALTAFDAIFTQAQLKSGETLLVHAVGSGVGTAAVQLAHNARARVYGTSRTPEKLERASALGLLGAFSSASFVDDVNQITGGAGADVVLDLVGGQTTARSFECLALCGRIVVLGLVGGREANVPLGELMRRRATLIGSVLRSRSLDEKIALHQILEREIAPLLQRGTLKPIVHATFPLAEARVALEMLAGNATFGKIVLVP
jgi:NADPH:quinone reductase